ncbi:MAG: flagellar hook assembly protein FlgD [Rhodobacteraceae bacterium]|nr:flagellar hook assembly protein FlgD [Paracoccaceae bacterium]
MDAVSAATQTQKTGATSGTQTSALSSDFKTFLLMLTTQMQNQDPLNPIESSDYAVQLATFSGVEQQVKTNTLLEALSTQLGLSGMAELASWVGMEARVAAPAEFDGSPLTLYPAPATGADRTVLVAYDAEGQEVSRTEIPVSSDPVEWAGTDASGAPLPSGAYSFRLENYAAGELATESAVEVFGRVDEVRATGSGTVLVMDSGAIVAASDVTAVRSGRTATGSN